MQTVRTGRKPNARLRTREYLTEAEVEQRIKAVSRNRHGQRDATLLLVIFRHGLRTSEACALRWADVDLEPGNAHVRRVKNGVPRAHPLSGRELRALRRLKRKQEPASPFVFTSERGSPFTRDGIVKLVARAGVEAGSDHDSLSKMRCRIQPGGGIPTMSDHVRDGRGVATLGTAWR
jgi:type 1 fimbriae regulatory protein FimB/type 1 fimbriae regulatory protein FimE